jgi:hypothetical protein
VEEIDWNSKVDFVRQKVLEDFIISQQFVTIRLNNCITLPYSLPPLKVDWNF